MRSPRWKAPDQNLEILPVQMNSLLDQFSETKLTQAEEAALVVRISHKDEAALNELVMANMREALRYTGKVCYDRIDFQTRISLCYQEMMMSGRRYIPRGNRFFAFAKQGLRGRMKTYWTSLNTVRNATEIVSVDRLEGRFRESDQGFFSPRINRAIEDDHEFSHRELVTGEVANSHLDSTIVKDHWREIRTRLHDRLSEQQWMILDLVYVSGLNFPQIGKLLGVTRSAIHAAHRKAINKLRAGIVADKRLLL